MNNITPHVYHTIDGDGNDCRHIAMCEEGAVRAHLLHYGKLEFDNDVLNDTDWKNVAVNDEGQIDPTDSRDSLICFEPSCIICGLSYGEDGGPECREKLRG